MNWIYSIKTKLILVISASSVLVGSIVYLLTPSMVQHEMIEVLMEDRIVLIEQVYRQIGSTTDSELDPVIIAESVKAQFDNPTTNPDGLPLDFMLVDKNGYVLIPNTKYKFGASVNLTFLNNVEEVMYQGSEIAYVHMDESIELTPREQTFMHALNETLISSVGWAIVILLPVGYWAGHRLSRTLKRLTDAVNDMTNGNLKQRVVANNLDESGALANAFNRMNEDLVRAYNEIAEAKHTIEKQAAQLKELSIRDELTGLYNRRYFNETAEKHFSMATRYNKSMVLVLADVDHFKKINDNFSHATGDEVLRTLSTILQNEIRDSDVVARYGGEEMAFSLLEVDLNEAINMMNRIRMLISDFDWSAIHKDLTVTMSFGLAETIPGESLANQLDRADTRLYQAKENGRNQVCG